MSWHERPYAGGELGGGSFAGNPLNWAPSIGRIFGIRIRVHILFILFVVFEILDSGGMFLFVSQYLFVMFGSVFLHELGHCFAARRLGGQADEVLMWPLGGLAFVDAPRRPWPQFVTVAGGPMVNVVLFCASWLILLVVERREAAVILNPFAGWSAAGSTWGHPLEWLRLVFKVNWVLFLFNLVPMYPLDGGRMLQCALWPRLGYTRAKALATSAGMVAAIALGLYALLNQQYLVLAIAFLGYMTCHQERAMLRAVWGEDGPAGVERWRGEDGWQPARPRRAGWWTRLRTRVATARRRREEAEIATLEVEVDRILEKVHREGVQSLSRAEKRILEQASRRPAQRR